METRVIGVDDVARILATIGRDAVMDRLIAELERGFAEMGRGAGEEPPPRSGFARGDASGVIEVMPHREAGGTVTMKVVSYSPDNRAMFGLPTVVGTLARYDERTGRLLGLADGILLTAMRTGAVAALATRLLARPRARVLGLVGAGAQAVTQAHGLSRVLPLERIVVTDAVPAHAESFASRVAFLGLPVEVAAPGELLATSDVVCTVTSVAAGAGPVVPDGEHVESLHVNAMGADEIGKVELPLGLLERAFVCVDHAGQARAEGEFQQLPDRDLGPTLSQLCASPERAQAQAHGLTVFDSTGSAFADHVTFTVFSAFAEELGLGIKVPVECRPEDILDPYSLPLREWRSTPPPAG